ncbi:hypothetical protein [Chishuiella changwenlii]|uniref:hypothetical protein n=1 Tax=Chishuiella changwenlii TaxID=1434701 RepID=UPI002FDAF653
MRNTYTLIAICAAMSFYSCNNKTEEQPKEEQVENQQTETTEEPTEIVTGVIRKSNVEWMGYKTTEKVGVPGHFDVVLVKNVNEEGKTPQEVLEGADIVALVSSLNSDMIVRDEKLKDILFGNMINTKEIKGQLHFKEGKTFLKLTLNNTSKEYEVQSSFENNVFTIEADVDLMHFNANKALTALNTACLDLHKGADGVSKTWSEVHIKGQVEFSESFGK